MRTCHAACTVFRRARSWHESWPAHHAWCGSAWAPGGQWQATSEVGAVEHRLKYSNVIKRGSLRCWDSGYKAWPGVRVYGRPGVTIKWAHVCPWLPYGMINSIFPAMNDVVLLLHHKRWSCGPGKSCASAHPQLVKSADARHGSIQ